MLNWICSGRPKRRKSNALRKLKLNHNDWLKKQYDFRLKKHAPNNKSWNSSSAPSGWKSRAMPPNWRHKNAARKSKASTQISRPLASSRSSNPAKFKKLKRDWPLRKKTCSICKPSYSSVPPKKISDLQSSRPFVVKLKQKPREGPKKHKN